MPAGSSHVRPIVQAAWENHSQQTRLRSEVQLNDHTEKNPVLELWVCGASAQFMRTLFGLNISKLCTQTSRFQLWLSGSASAISDWGSFGWGVRSASPHADHILITHQSRNNSFKHLFIWNSREVSGSHSDLPVLVTVEENSVKASSSGASKGGLFLQSKFKEKSSESWFLWAFTY